MIPANDRNYLTNPITESEMKETYIEAFGKEYDSKDRKQPPLPLEIAYLVAVRVLETKVN